MPLNSLVCPACGAHVNYAVDIDADVQTITCRRCKAAIPVAQADLDPVIRETVANLRELRAQEAAQQAEYDRASNDDDAVDAAIDRAQGAFAEAKERLGGLAEEISELTDTMAIVDEFTVGEGLDDLSTVGAATAQQQIAAAASGDLFGSRVAEKVATKLKFTDEERLAATYAKELYTYCKSRNIKLIDAVSDTEWQKWFISTLKVEDDTKSSLTRLVQSDQFRSKVSAVMRRFS